MYWNSNGFCDVECCLKKQKFTKYNGWKDPELANKPKIRSIPNIMKRFMAELRGELTVKDRDARQSSADTRGSQFTNASVLTGSIYTKRSATPKSPILLEPGGYKVDMAEGVAKYQRLRKAMDRKSGTSVVRCETCDYPYDGTKRRKPPHMYKPVVIFLPQSGLRGDEDDGRPSQGGIKDMPSFKVNKVMRMKRRRSSTELYKGLVSVD